MSTSETQQGFPRIQGEFVNADLTINQVWLQLLITMWNRTGGAAGASTNDAVLLAVANDALARTRDDQNSGGNEQFTVDLSSGLGGGAASGLAALTTLADGALPQQDGLAALLLLEAPRASAASASVLTQDHIFVGNSANLPGDVAMSGDATIVASGNLTLANTSVSAGAYGNTSVFTTLTVDSKGRLTAAGNVSLVAGSGITLTPGTGNLTIASGGSGNTTSTATFSVAATASTGPSTAAFGVVITPVVNMSLTGMGLILTTASSGTYKLGVAPWNAGTSRITGGPTYAATFTEGTGAAHRSIFENFSGSVALTAGTAYLLIGVRTDATASTATTVDYQAAASAQGPGLYIAATGVAFQLASLAPGTGDTWSSSGSGIWAFQLVYTI